MRKRIVVGVVLLLVAGGGLLAFQREQATIDQPAKTVPKVVTLDRANMVATAEAPPTAPPDRKPPALFALGGVHVNLDGQTARKAIDKLSQAARRGDADAAFQVYQVESMCNEVDVERRLFTTITGMPESQKKDNLARVEAAAKVCEGVTLAQKQERIQFLEQAARTGNHDAMFAYRIEGPNGTETADPQSKDPNVVAWRQKSLEYLSTLAQAGDARAWSVLGIDYKTGVTGVKNDTEAVKYDSAIVLSKHPEVDPLKFNYIAAIAKNLTPEQAKNAVEQGRALASKFPRSQS